MEVGDTVKFKDGSPILEYLKKYDEQCAYYRIMVISKPGAYCVNKGIALRPISNNLSKLIYMSGDLMNQHEDTLEIVNIVMKPKIF